MPYELGHGRGAGNCRLLWCPRIRLKVIDQGPIKLLNTKSAVIDPPVFRGNGGGGTNHCATAHARWIQTRQPYLRRSS